MTQGLWQQNAPTFVQKVSWSYLFGEGWAHHTEQMMAGEGFSAERPEVRLAQMSDALLRNCRRRSAIASSSSRSTTLCSRMARRPSR